MDKAPHGEEIPAVVIEAYGQLLQQRIVEIVEPLAADQYKGAPAWSFRCQAPVPVPNKEQLPSPIALKVVIPESFPYVPVEVFSETPDVVGFPHQDAESGKLCLPEERLASRDASRLTRYVAWAIEWLADASAGTLLKEGDPFELPDFSRKQLPEKRRTLTESLIFTEDEESYRIWENQSGSSGVVECSMAAAMPVVLARRFLGDAGVLRESSFAESINNLRESIRGRWIIVRDIRYRRHRPPQTYKELEHVCRSQGLSLYEILHRAWDENNANPRVGILLVGFPIPRTVGAAPVEMHWQPLFFPNKIAESKAEHGKHRRKPHAIWQELIQKGRFAPYEQLPWSESRNVSSKRLCARGGLAGSVRSQRVALFGCGALGSLVAEMLVRGGLRKVAFFDPDSLQFGNLCRHTLDGSAIGAGKAVALAHRLQSVNPTAAVSGYSVGAPVGLSAPADAREALENVDLIIDCTTSDAAFEWLDDYAKSNQKRLVMLFIDFRASLMTVCVSGETSCSDIYWDLQQRISGGETPVDAGQYFYRASKDDLVMEGIGCWHPTFPAAGSHIAALAASAVDLVASHLSASPGGLAAVLRRQSTGNGPAAGPLLEIAWIRNYP